MLLALINLITFFKRFIFGIFAFIMMGKIRADRKQSGREIGGRIGKGPQVGIRTCDAQGRRWDFLTGGDQAVSSPIVSGGVRGCAWSMNPVP